MANEINIYEPRYLAEAVRTAPPICTFLRDRFFSKVKTFPTKNVDIDIVKGNRKMAAFVHPMVGGEIVQNEGYETKSYAPPLINPATVTTADMFLQRLPGEDKFGTNVTKNPFSATFSSLDGLTVTGVWNAEQARVEF